MNLSIPSLRAGYASRLLAPREVIEQIYDEIERRGTAPVWISLVPREAALERAGRLTGTEPLYGIPFAVKDNIDVAGMPTTAGCPAFAYTPGRTAFAVERLLEAGAILIGKTNLDQFATGLVGVRSPYGACSSVFHPDYISGGSSSGSAVAVASELVSFALGTDTAGSGRVPAAFNNLTGMKPTHGLLSTSGVVPACRSLDCVSIFALNSSDAGAVFAAACAFDAADPFSRRYQPGSAWSPTAFRFGVPRRDQWQFFGDNDSESLFEAALARLQELGGTHVEIDFTPFREAAGLLYAGPYVAERLAAIESFAADHAGEMHPVVRNIITGAAKYSAVEAYRAEYRLRELRRATEPVWQDIHFLTLPTAPTIYRHNEVAQDPVRLNTNLGYYTNFVNLLDLSAIAIPAGFRENPRLPFGISLIAPAMADDALLATAGRFSGEVLYTGARCPPGYIRLAVVGAHLTGQPLNGQLTQRGAFLLETTRTSAAYRLYALAGTTPAKPGLVYEPGFDGPGIEVEVWAIPGSEFGGFVDLIPSPLGIGKVQLSPGSPVSCFICEGHPLANSAEITRFGGWRNYLVNSNR